MPKKNLLDLIETQAATLTSESESDSAHAKPDTDLQQRIQELETEVIQLRVIAKSEQDKVDLEQHIQELTKTLASESGEHEIALDLLDLDPAQPRTIFPQQLIAERAESLRRNDQISPIIVIPQPNGRYRIFDGAIRKLAAPRAGKTSLRSVFLTKHDIVDENSRFEKQFVTGKDAEKLHYLDLANGLLRIICHRYPYLKSQQLDIPNILNNAIYQVKKVGKLTELNQIRNRSTEQQQEWLENIAFDSTPARDVLTVILDRQFNPASVASNIFPILAISDDLKTIVAETGLDPSKVKAITKLSAEALKVDEETARNIRLQVAYKVTEEEKSLLATNELIRQTIQQYNPTVTPVPQLDLKAEKAIKQIQNLKFEGLDQQNLQGIRNTLRQRLKELDTLIKANSR